MDHITYLDYKARELENLQKGVKSMIVRGAMGRKMPYGRVNQGDILYFMENKGDGLIKAKAHVKGVFNSEQLTKDESVELIWSRQDKLQLDAGLLKRFAGKRYIVLIEIKDFEMLDPFEIDRSDYGNMDDWLPVGEISSVVSKRLKQNHHCIENED